MVSARSGKSAKGHEIHITNQKKVGRLHYSSVKIVKTDIISSRKITFHAKQQHKIEQTLSTNRDSIKLFNKLKALKASLENGASM